MRGSATVPAGHEKTEDRQPISRERVWNISGLRCEMGVSPRFFRVLLPLAALSGIVLFGQTRTMKQGAHRMEITLERLEGDKWRAVDPGLVLAQGDRVRFRYRTSFDGYLYVTDLGTSGKYDQLFPGEQTGRDNRVASLKEYQVPATENTVFRIAGPAGHDVVYWMVSPTKLTDVSPGKLPPATPPAPKPGLIPRCDDVVLRARGDCVDSSAGAKPGLQARDLVFMRDGMQTVISSPTALAGPVVYEFRLAHK
jgi:hypothetical protein